MKGNPISLKKRDVNINIPRDINFLLSNWQRSNTLLIFWPGCGETFRNWCKHNGGQFGNINQKAECIYLWLSSLPFRNRSNKTLRVQKSLMKKTVPAALFLITKLESNLNVCQQGTSSIPYGEILYSYKKNGAPLIWNYQQDILWSEKNNKVQKFPRQLRTQWQVMRIRRLIFSVHILLYFLNFIA